MNDDTITLTLEDDSEITCSILALFPAGDKQYIALLPEGGEDIESEVYLYGYTETESGELELFNIEDDEEYEIVADAFDELLDEAEFEELEELEEDNE